MERLWIIAEPVTAITDVMVAIAALYFLFKIQGLGSRKPFIKYWLNFFLFTSVSTALGGIAHSFHQKAGNSIHATFWVLMQIATGISVYFIVCASIVSEVRTKKVKRLLLKLAFVQVCLFTGSVTFFMDFRAVVVNSALGVFSVFILNYPESLRQVTHKTFILYSLLVSVLTVIVNLKKIRLHEYFNHHDMAHVLMFISLLLFYKAILYKNRTESLFTN